MAVTAAEAAAAGGGRKRAFGACWLQAPGLWVSKPAMRSKSIACPLHFCPAGSADRRLRTWHRSCQQLPSGNPCPADLVLDAALWAWNVWSRVQQRQEDRRILDAMLRLPLAITEHAACRMDCRCAGGGRREAAL